MSREAKKKVRKSANRRSNTRIAEFAKILPAGVVWDTLPANDGRFHSAAAAGFATAAAAESASTRDRSAGVRATSQRSGLDGLCADSSRPASAQPAG